MPFPALLDTNVLIPIRLADLLLRLAEAGTYRPLWSEDILTEVERNLIGKFGLDPAKAKRRVAMMREVFPDAMVTGYEPLIPVMTNDPKDRHVLAAAVRANAAVIITFNRKDFPAAALDPYEIDAVNPDNFLLDQFELYQRPIITCLQEQLAALQRPQETVAQFFGRFHRTVPRFAARAETTFTGRGAPALSFSAVPKQNDTGAD
ncbi:PIN domain-containing protein [Amycolatopsis sp. NPDC058986]|uniref:PIN domain-containing protein n=1 Tax=unclassified Amycolatopsis TaxID=2618356 RepID=UPI00366AC0EF